MDLAKLPVNVFDFVLVAFLLFGLLRGRKHGMSEELLPLLKWLAVVVGCSVVYQPAGKWFSELTHFSLLFSYIGVYVVTGLLILSIFSLFKRGLGGKLIGSDVFGQSEYYLGMASGSLRYACVLVTLLALLNARSFSRTEVSAMTSYQKDVYGSEFFPTLHTAQAAVFERSLSGPWISQYLSFLLIEPTRPEKKEFHQKEFTLQ
ncbi:MAG: hypothetical protein C5B50_23990 [Verrucomicrobia bacterium]|nr:MAG: hypothetical protein C5B50_23990 [Verrucomicrobiota bacterium]